MRCQVCRTRPATEVRQYPLQALNMAICDHCRDNIQRIKDRKKPGNK